ATRTIRLHVRFAQGYEFWYNMGTGTNVTGNMEQRNGSAHLPAFGQEHMGLRAPAWGRVLAHRLARQSPCARAVSLASRSAATADRRWIALVASQRRAKAACAHRFCKEQMKCGLNW